MMLWWRRCLAKLRGIDDFYAELEAKNIEAYQQFVERALKTIDLNNETAWSRGDEYDRDQLERDERALNEIAQQAEVEGLAPAFVFVTVHQYVFADPWRREMDRQYWVRRVMRRKDVDYFPSGWAMYKLLDMQSE